MEEVFREKDKGVSAIVGTILIVAITVVLAATVYGVLTGFGGLIGGVAPTGSITVSGSAGSYTISVTSVSANVPLSKVQIKVTDASSTYTSAITAGPVDGYTITLSPTSATNFNATLSITLTNSAASPPALTAISIVDTSPSGTIASWTAT